MYKKLVTITLATALGTLFFENHAMPRNVQTITINYRNGYPSSHNQHSGSSTSDGHGSHLQGLSTPWTKDIFSKAPIGSTNIIPGCTNVSIGTPFAPNASDYTIMALQSLNNGPNSSIMQPDVRIHETISHNGFVIPSDAQIAMGKMPYFRINDNDNLQVKLNKAEFNSCVERAFNNEMSGLELIAFAAICKKK